MMTLLSVLLAAVQALPNAAYVSAKILRKQTMSLSQKIIAAVYSLTEKEQFGFYVAEEPVLIEAIIEATEMPFDEDSVSEVKSHLRGMTTPLKGIGIEITKNGDYLTVWGPGVRHV
jgi:hypothetical protein